MCNDILVGQIFADGLQNWVVYKMHLISFAIIETLRNTAPYEHDLFDFDAKHCLLTRKQILESDNLAICNIPN